MNKIAAESFAKWLAQDQPALFVALYKKAVPAQTRQELSGFTDVLSSIGSSLGNAVSQVGSFLASPAGIQTVSTIGGAYLQSQAAKQATQLQMARAQSGQYAVPIQTAYNPVTQQYEPLLIQPSGQAVPITAQMARELAPNMPMWAWFSIGGVALFLIAILAFRGK